MSYRVAEIFTSINGEGQFVGKMAVFVRLAYCNLACSYCDTRWANGPDAPFKEMEGEEIRAYIRQSGASHVTLTGGEPLLGPGVGDLLRYLSEDPSLSIEVETNGSIGLGPFKDLGRENIFFTMDYKLPDSAMEKEMDLGNLALLGPRDVLKFVISSKRDMDRAYDLIRTHDLDKRTQVYFSPSYREIEAREMVDFIIEKKLASVRVQIQIHKYIWDPDQRGV